MTDINQMIHLAMAEGNNELATKLVELATVQTRSTLLAPVVRQEPTPQYYYEEPEEEFYYEDAVDYSPAYYIPQRRNVQWYWLITGFLIVMATAQVAGPGFSKFKFPLVGIVDVPFMQHKTEVASDSQ